MGGVSSASGGQNSGLRKLDLLTLKALCVLLEESHVSNAAERMGVTQPSMSATLAQLRHVFNDPLLVRTGKGMMATPNGVQIAKRARQALELLEESLTMTRAFDPQTSTMTLRISATESVGFMLVPRLTRLLEQRAPQVRLQIHPAEPARLREQLQEGEADLVVSYQPHAPDTLYTATLYQQQLRVVAARSHPLIQGKISMEQYLHARHVYYQPAAGKSTIEMQVDEAFAAQGRKRHVGVSVPSALASAPVVAASSHIATLTRAVAEHAARANDLQVLDAPIQLGFVRVAMFWHERTHSSPAHAWFRQAIRELFHAEHP